MPEAERLRDIAANCRQVARIVDTRTTIETLLRMAEDYERKADEAEKRYSPH